MREEIVIVVLQLQPKGPKSDEVVNETIFSNTFYQRILSHFKMVIILLHICESLYFMFYLRVCSFYVFSPLILIELLFVLLQLPE